MYALQHYLSALFQARKALSHCVTLLDSNSVYFREVPGLVVVAVGSQPSANT